MIDWEKTNKNVVELLAKEKAPWHYKQLYHKTVISDDKPYSETTDPIEKFRQHYCETRRDAVGFVQGGYLVLRKWFKSRQLSLFSHDPLVLKGNCLVSYDAGYEMAKREPHMKDWYNDARTITRKERRRRAALFEHHVRFYFQTHYNQFYSPPSNYNDYEAPAKEDFFLRVRGAEYPVDAKSYTYEDNGHHVGTARNPRDGIIYLWGDWQDDETTLMYGISGGGWTKSVGTDYGRGLIHIKDNCIWPIDCLLVMLNMAQMDLDYNEFYNNLN